MKDFLLAGTKSKVWELFCCPVSSEMVLCLRSSERGNWRVRIWVISVGTYWLGLCGLGYVFEEGSMNIGPQLET